MIEFEKKEQNYLLKEYGYWQLQLDTILKTYGTGMSKEEFVLFLSKAKQYQLSVERGEIWGYKDNKGNMVMFTGRDGFLSLAHRDPWFAWLNSSEVCENDKFEMDIANQKIVHQMNWKDRGPIIWAYAIAYKKDCMPVMEWVDIKTYNKWSYVRASHTAQMIKKVAEVHALKKQFGITWLYGSEEAESMGMARNNQNWEDFLTENSEEVQQIIKSIEEAQSSSELDKISDDIRKIKKQISKTQQADLTKQRVMRRKYLKDLSDNPIEWEILNTTP